MSEGKEDTKVSWHLDQRVSIGVIFLLLANMATTGGTTVWWASKVDNTLENYGKIPAEVAELRKQFAILDKKQTQLETKLDLETRYLFDLRTLLKDLGNTMQKFGSEQSKRGPRIKNNEENIKRLRNKHHP